MTDTIQAVISEKFRHIDRDFLKFYYYSAILPVVYGLIPADIVAAFLKATHLPTPVWFINETQEAALFIGFIIGVVGAVRIFIEIDQAPKTELPDE